MLRFIIYLSYKNNQSKYTSQFVKDDFIHNGKEIQINWPYVDVIYLNLITDYATMFKVEKITMK